MEVGTLLLIVVPVLLVVILKTLYDGGKKALSIFPAIESVKVVYRDTVATGYSTQSWKTKVGGASRSIDIVVTDQELWLKSIVLFAHVTRQHGLLHKVPLRNVIKARQEGEHVKIDFKNGHGDNRQVIVRTRDRAAFIKALRK